jgi:hypothetical protein
MCASPCTQVCFLNLAGTQSCIIACKRLFLLTVCQLFWLAVCQRIIVHAIMFLECFSHSLLRVYFEGYSNAHVTVLLL